MTSVIKDAHEYVDPPSRNPERWPQTTCVAWCAARGITLEHLLEGVQYELDEDLRELLAAAKATPQQLRAVPTHCIRSVIAKIIDNTALPPLLSQSCCKTKDVLELVQSLQGMLSSIMSETFTEEYIEIVDQRIKLFLSLFHRVSASVEATGTSRSTKRQRAQPQWLTSYNFVCLLNIPQMIRMFGPVRNVWDGGLCAERFIQTPKALLAHGLFNNWDYVTCNQMLVDLSMKRLVNAYTSPRIQYPKSCDYRYKDLTDIVSQLNYGTVLVAFTVDGGTCGL